MSDYTAANTIRSLYTTKHGAKIVCVRKFLANVEHKLNVKIVGLRKLAMGDCWVASGPVYFDEDCVLHDASGGDIKLYNTTGPRLVVKCDDCVS